jgi:hypothetical protein
LDFAHVEIRAIFFSRQNIRVIVRAFVQTKLRMSSSSGTAALLTPESLVNLNEYGDMYIKEIFTHDLHLYNHDAENAVGGRETRVTFSGFDADAVPHTLALVEARAKYGTSDQSGVVCIKTNRGTDGLNLTHDTLTLDAEGNLQVFNGTGDVILDLSAADQKLQVAKIQVADLALSGTESVISINSKWRMRVVSDCLMFEYNVGGDVGWARQNMFVPNPNTGVLAPPSGSYSMSGLQAPTAEDYVVMYSSSSFKKSDVRTDSLVTLDATQTLSNKTLSSPTILSSCILPPDIVVAGSLSDHQIGGADDFFVIMGGNETGSRQLKRSNFTISQLAGLIAGSAGATGVIGDVFKASNNTFSANNTFNGNVTFADNSAVVGGIVAPKLLTVPSFTNLESPMLFGNMAATGATVTGATLDGGSIKAGTTLVNDGTISGGTISGASISTNSATITGGAISGVSSIATIGDATVGGSLAMNSGGSLTGTLSGGTLNPATLSGTIAASGATVTGATLDGGSIKAGATLVNNGTISGGTISGASISTNNATITGGTISDVSSIATIGNATVGGSLAMNGGGSLTGTLSGGTLNPATLSGTIAASGATVTGATLDGGSIKAGTTLVNDGTISGGTISGASISTNNATITGGTISGVSSIATTGNATVGGSLAMNGGGSLTGTLSGGTLNPATLSGTIAASGATVTGATLDGGSIKAGTTLVNDGTISGGTISGASISTNNATITGGTISGVSSIATTGNATVVGSLAMNGGGSLTGTLSGGTLNPATLNVANDAVINGSLTVMGTTTTINSTELSITDKCILLAQPADPQTNPPQLSGAVGAGLEIAHPDGPKGFKFAQPSDSTTAAFASDVGLDISSAHAYQIGGTKVLTASNVKVGDWNLRQTDGDLYVEQSGGTTAKKVFVSSTLSVTGLTKLTGGASIPNGATVTVQTGGAIRLAENTATLNLSSDNTTTFITPHVTETAEATLSGTLRGGNLKPDSLEVTGVTTLSNTTDATSASVGGSLTVSGGAGIAKKVFLGSTLGVTGATTLSNTTDATSASAGGCLTVLGGAGIAKKVFLGSTLDVAGATTLSNTTDATSASAGGCLTVLGGAGIAKKVFLGSTLDVAGATTLSNATDATSASAGGCLTVLGGAGIAKKMFVGDTLSVTAANELSLVKIGDTFPSAASTYSAVIDSVNNTNGKTFCGIAFKHSSGISPELSPGGAITFTRTGGASQGYVSIAAKGTTTSLGDLTECARFTSSGITVPGTGTLRVGSSTSTNGLLNLNTGTTGIKIVTHDANAASITPATGFFGLGITSGQQNYYATNLGAHVFHTGGSGLATDIDTYEVVRINANGATVSAGKTLTLTGATVTGGTISSATISGTTTIDTSGTATLGGLLTANGGITVSTGKTLTLTGATVTGGTISSATISGTTTINTSGTATLGGLLTANGGITVPNGQSVSVGGLTTLTGGASIPNGATVTVQTGGIIRLAGTGKLNLSSDNTTTYISASATSTDALMAGNFRIGSNSEIKLTSTTSKFVLSSDTAETTTIKPHATQTEAALSGTLRGGALIPASLEVTGDTTLSGTLAANGGLSTSQVKIASTLEGSQKLVLYDDFATFYGMGISANLMSYTVPGNSRHAFLSGTSETFSVDASGATVTGGLSVAGNLAVSGNTTFYGTVKMGMNSRLAFDRAELFSANSTNAWTKGAFLTKTTSTTGGLTVTLDVDSTTFPNGISWGVTVVKISDDYSNNYAGNSELAAYTSTPFTVRANGYWIPGGSAATYPTTYPIYGPLTASTARLPQGYYLFRVTTLKDISASNADSQLYSVRDYYGWSTGSLPNNTSIAGVYLFHENSTIRRP